MKLWIFAGLLAVAFPVAADMFKCKGADGRITYRDTPCAGTSATEKKISTEAYGGSQASSPLVTWREVDELVFRGESTKDLYERGKLFDSAARLMCTSSRQGVSTAQAESAREFHRRYNLRAMAQKAYTSRMQFLRLSEAYLGVANGKCVLPEYAKSRKETATLPAPAPAPPPAMNSTMFTCRESGCWDEYGNFYPNGHGGHRYSGRYERDCRMIDGMMHCP